jgi:hypothetical protein
LFTAAASRRAEVIGVAAETVSVTRIGAITATADLAVLDETGAPVETATGAYDHFGR